MNARLQSPSLAAVRQRDELAEAFPDIDPRHKPCGSLILVQVRRARNKKQLAGGHTLHLPDEAVETEKWNTQVGLVRIVGPLAFLNRNTLQPWPEGAWCKVGDFVRISKYTPDRWEVPYGPGDDEKALFTIVKDTDILAIVTGDPLTIKAFV